VQNDSYVVDIGTGTGVLAFYAAKAGARRVTGIDVNPDSIEYARLAAKQNGLEDITDFKVCHFSEFVPDEEADVVICEMLSSIMLVEQQVDACKYAIQSILKKEGNIIPRNATVYVAPAECPSIWQRTVLDELEFPRLPQTSDSGQSEDLANLEVLKVFDFSSVNQNNPVDKVIEFSIVADGRVNGIGGLFEAELTDSIKLTMEDGWRDLFMPLKEPIDVEEGTMLKVRISYVPGKLKSLGISVQ
jgi:predicted RNA methylase